MQALTRAGTPTNARRLFSAARRRAPQRSPLPACAPTIADSSTTSRRAGATRLTLPCAPRPSTSRASSGTRCSIACASTVLTSATLAVDGSFEYVKGGSAFETPRKSASPPSSTTPRRRCSTCPPHASTEGAGVRRGGGARDHRDPQALARPRVRAVHQLRGAAAVQHFVEMALPYPILVQGTAPRTVLIEQFRTTPNAVLLATSSFWQGVDVVGEALSCVIIDKLPFASPGDPVTAARIDAINARRRRRVRRLSGAAGDPGAAAGTRDG